VTTTEYNKLVRDKVPTQMRARGLGVRTRHEDNPYRFVAILADKLVEESGEFLTSWSIEELADIQETVDALARELSSLKHLKHVRQTKARIRGTFKNRVVLESIERP
jgi:predicted house-cleaning noncanonical NTP pyrophosphatase (MazG superfamily)